MTRSRLLTISTSVVLFGAALALAAAVLDQTQVRGPLPAEAKVLPADARYLLGVDVRRFVESPLYKNRKPQAKEPYILQILAEVKRRTGIDPEKEIGQMVLAGGRSDEAGDALLILGTWDASRAKKTLAGQKDVKATKRRGRFVYDFAAEPGRPPRALAFVSDRVLLLGTPETIAAGLDGTGAAGTPPALSGLLDRVTPGAAFWVCGDGSVLSQMDKVLPGATSGFPLPELKALVISATLDPLLDASLFGEATTPAAAKTLADMVRGLLSLAALQGARRPEMQELASAIAVTQEGTNLGLTLRFPYDLIERLSAPRPVARPIAAP